MIVLLIFPWPYQYVKDKIVKHLLPVAKRHQLDLEAFGEFFGDVHSTATGGVLKATSNSFVTSLFWPTAPSLTFSTAFPSQRAFTRACHPNLRLCPLGNPLVNDPAHFRRQISRRACSVPLLYASRPYFLFRWMSTSTSVLA